MRWVLVALIACRSSNTLHPVAGSDKDEGHGDLASASAKIMTASGSADDPFAPRRNKPQEFGGTTYGNYVVPNWSTPPAVHRTHPRHQQTAGLGGAIEGTITWKGTLPAKRATPCGPQMLTRVGDGRGIADVVIYIEQVKTGRTMPSDGRSAMVGGAIVKKGCLLLPTAQIVTPLPAAVSLHGDATKARLRVTAPGGPVRQVELQAGGRDAITVAPGVTRVDTEDGTLSGAWVLGLDAPYFAITDDKGQFRIDELAPGTYEVTVWHPPLPNEGAGPLTYGAPIVMKRSVTVAGMKPSRLDLALGR